MQIEPIKLIIKMSQGDVTSKSNPKNNLKEKENLSKINNNNKESYLYIKTKKIKFEKFQKKKGTINYEELKNNDEDIHKNKTRKRSNSVDLYKKQKKEKEKKIKKEIIKSINPDNRIIYDVAGSKNINIKIIKKNKNGNEKKVNFPKNFVTIIDVESYKKFNEENTCKDPFEDLDLMQQLKNNIINNSFEEEKNNGKEQVHCSCFIY